MRQYKIYEKKYSKQANEVINGTIGHRTDLCTTINRTYGKKMTAANSQTYFKGSS